MKKILLTVMGVICSLGIWADSTVKTVDGTTTTWDLTAITADMCSALSSSSWTNTESEKCYKSTANGGEESPAFLGGLTINTCGSDKSRVYYDGKTGYCFNGGSAYMLIPVSEGQTLEVYSAQTIVSATSDVTMKSNNGVWTANIPSGVTSVKVKRNSGATYITKVVTKTESGKASDLTVTSSQSLVLEKGATSTIAYTTTSTGAVSFTSTNPSVATVSDAGVITAVASGCDTIKINQAAAGEYREGSAEVYVAIPYDVTKADTYLINSSNYGFSASDNKTYYYKNGITVSISAAKAYGTATLKGSIKYSANTTYTINIPEGVTISALKITARSNYDTGTDAAKLGKIDGTDYTDALPYSSEDPVTKTIALASPKTGGTIEITPTGNQVQMIIELLTPTATAISNVKTSTENGVAYNVAGQRVNANAKGMIIMNGKKYMVK